VSRSLFQQQLDRAGFIDEVQENAGRHAIAYGSFITTGNGEISNPDVLRFNTSFVHMPAVSYSYYVDEDDLVDGQWPRCWGGVLGWEVSNRDDFNLYTGAYAFVVVETSSYQFPPEDISEPEYEIRHFFTFNGVGLKFVPADFASAQIAKGKE